jgi:hypothetical protein
MSYSSGALKYRPPRQFVQFHDATLLWPEAPREFIALWKEYMDVEFPAMAKMLGGDLK